MSRKPIAFSVACAAALLAACNAHPGSSVMPANYVMPAIDSDLSVTANVAPRTVGEELPSEGLGSVHSSKWKATVGGYTQTTRSQVLGFNPGVTITVRNLSKTQAHTFNVVKTVMGTPAKFPSNPALTFTPRGKGVLGPGYASGAIAPGKSVKIKLDKPGRYLIGCAFHYHEGMRDVIVVLKGAKPGPQATPAGRGPGNTPTPRPTPTYGGGGGGSGW